MNDAWNLDHLRAPAANQDRKLRRRLIDPNSWTNRQMLMFCLALILIAGVTR